MSLLKKKKKILDDPGPLTPLSKKPELPFNKKPKLPLFEPDKNGHVPMRLPEKINKSRITVKSLTARRYHARILDYFSSEAIPAAMNCLISEAKGGDVTASKVILETYEFLQKKGFNFNVNQNTATIGFSARRDREELEGPLTFEEIARMASESRQKRLAAPAAQTIVCDPVFEETPEE